MGVDRQELPKGVSVERTDHSGHPAAYFVRITESCSGTRKYYGNFSDPHAAAHFANQCREANRNRQPHPPRVIGDQYRGATRASSQALDIKTALGDWLAWKFHDTKIGADQYASYERWVVRLSSHSRLVAAQYVENVTLDMVSNIVEGLAAEGYSKNSCKMAVSTLRNSFKYANFQERIDRNPLEGGWDSLWLRCQWPELQPAPAVGLPTILAISNRLRPASRAPLWIFYLAGLRISEGFGLDIGDFDPTTPSLNVDSIGGGGISEWKHDEAGIRIGKERGFAAERTKSAMSKRTVIIPRWLADLLTEYIERFHRKCPAPATQLFVLEQSSGQNALSGTWRKEFSSAAEQVMQYRSPEGLSVCHGSGDQVFGTPPISTARREGEALVLDARGPVHLSPKFVGPEPLLSYEPGWSPHPHWLRECCAAIAAKVLHLPGPLISDYLGHARPQHEDGTAEATHIYTGRRAGASEARVAAEFDRWISASLDVGPSDVLAAPSPARYERRLAAVAGQESAPGCGLDEESLFTVKEVASAVGLTAGAIYAAVKGGRLAPIPGVHPMLFTPESVENLKSNYGVVPPGWLATREVRADLGGLSEASFDRAVNHLQLDDERTRVRGRAYISPYGFGLLRSYIHKFSESVVDLAAELGVEAGAVLRAVEGPQYRTIDNASGKWVTVEAADVARRRHTEFRDWWRVRELSEELGVSVFDLYKRIEAGDIESVRLGELVLARPPRD